MNIFDNIIDSELYLAKIRKQENIICYGAGSKGAQTIKILRESNIFPVAFCDNHPKYKEESIVFCDLPVLSYKELKKIYFKYCILITCTINNAMEIYQMLMDEREINPVFFLSNPFKAENKLLSKTEISINIKAYQKTMDLLSDDISKKLYINFLNWKMTGDQRFTSLEKNNSNWLEWFDEKLIPNDEYIYIDVGAYTGDTILRFLAFCRGKYKEILAYEPDETNFSFLKDLLYYGRLEVEKIKINKLGLWSECCEKIFYSLGASDIVYESSNFFRSVENTLNNQLNGEVGANSEKVILVNKLDNLIYKKGNYLIKIDTLASEFPIIKGARKLIQENKPKLILEFGTYSSDIADIIPFLFELCSDYKFYLRQKKVFDNSRTILYVI